MRKAYNIVTIVQVNDKQKFFEYVQGHIPTVEQYGGRFLVRGAVGEVLEGEWPNGLTVIQEFPSVEIFKAWYHSDEYRPWKQLRQSCAEVNAMLVEGV